MPPMKKEDLKPSKARFGSCCFSFMGDFCEVCQGFGAVRDKVATLFFCSIFFCSKGRVTKRFGAAFMEFAWTFTISWL